jgi:DNA-binding MarR family transcriptional regulator
MHGCRNRPLSIPSIREDPPVTVMHPGPRRPAGAPPPAVEEPPGPVAPAAATPAPVAAAPSVPVSPGAPAARPEHAPRRPRRSDPAAGPALPEALVRVRHRTAPSRVIARTFEADLSAPVVAAGTRITNVRQITERVAMGRALWRELVVGFASQLGELNLGFTQLAALYVLAEGATTTIADLAESIGRSPSATSRLVDGLVRRRLVERRREDEDGRLRTVWLTPRGQAILRMVDRARAEQFLSAVRPLPRGERALIAMGVAALATHAISRRGRLVRGST